MNLFWLHRNMQINAKHYCKSHLGKILLEASQLLYTAHHLSNNADQVAQCAPFNVSKTQRGYALSHKHHPLAFWVRSSRHAYLCVCNLANALANEFLAQHNKQHACHEHVTWLSANIPPQIAAKEDAFTVPPQCVTEKCKVVTRMPADATPEQVCEQKWQDLIAAYRNCYFLDKMPLLQYDPERAPDWLVQRGWSLLKVQEAQEGKQLAKEWELEEKQARKRKASSNEQQAKKRRKL